MSTNVSSLPLDWLYVDPFRLETFWSFFLFKGRLTKPTFPRQKFWVNEISDNSHRFFSINSAYSALGSESKECCSFDFNTSPVYGFATPPLLTFEVALCPVLTHVDTGKSMDQYTWAKRGWCRMETQFKKNERNKLTFFGWELCLSGVWRFFSIIFIPKFGEDGWSQRVGRAFGHPNSEEDLFGENSLPPEPTDILHVEFSTVSRIESSLFAPDFLWRDCFFFVFFFGASFGSPRNAQCDIFCLPICWCWWLKARNIWRWWIYGMPSSLPSELAISHRTAMGQIPRSPVGFIRHLGEVWGSCGFSTTNS